MMRARTPPAHVVPAEAILGAEDAWAACFELDGRRGTVALEPEGWLAASVPLEGPPDLFLDRQSQVRGPAKVVEGLALRVDWPAPGWEPETLALLRGFLRSARHTLEGNGEPPGSGAGPGLPAAAKPLEAYAAASPWAVSREGDTWTFRVETARLTYRITAAPEGEALRFASILARAWDPGPVVRRALAHFLLHLNGRLRLARGALADGAAVLEVILPAGEAEPRMIERAIGAVLAGAMAARRACGALLDPAVAEAYCNFHLGEAKGGSS